MINAKRHSLVNSVFKSVCLLRKQVLRFENPVFFDFNPDIFTKQTNDGIFSKKAGENFHLAKMFFNVRVRL